MNKKLGFSLLALVLLASVVALQASASPPNHANRLEATFTETNVSVTNRIADLGIFQLINSGIGKLEGFGDATMTLAMSQDRSVQPCGPGSWTNAGIRRIVVNDGVLILRSVADVCQTAAGPVAHETWSIDGASSTGVFAGARGEGEGTVDITTRTSTLSGKLNLAGPID